MIDDDISYLKDNNKSLQIREAVNTEDVKDMVAPISGGLTIALIIVLLMSILVIIFVVFGVILITSFIVEIFSKLLEKILDLFSGEVQLSNKNLRNNKLVISSVILSSLMIGLIIMIFSISSSLDNYITGIQGRAGSVILLSLISIFPTLRLQKIKVMEELKYE